jgi:uncharacterized protein (DUF433 family)
MSTTFSRISKVPERCGGDACIRDTRIPVWVLAEWHKQGKSDAWLLANYPTLTTADLEAAWEYAAANSEEIADATHRNTET